MRELNCAHVLTAADAPVAGSHTIRIDGDRIAAVAAAPGANGKRLFAMPALVNAHDHARTESAQRDADHAGAQPGGARVKPAKSNPGDTIQDTSVQPSPAASAACIARVAAARSAASNAAETLACFDAQGAYQAALPQP